MDPASAAAPDDDDVVGKGLALSNLYAQGQLSRGEVRVALFLKQCEAQRVSCSASRRWLHAKQRALLLAVGAAAAASAYCQQPLASVLLVLL